MNELTVVDRTLITKYLQSFGLANKLSKDQIEQFVTIATSFKLNPFMREIYCIPYGDKLNIITGYEVYLKRADRSGQLNGWEVEVDENNNATITIHRKGWDNPLVHTVLFKEYKRNVAIWNEKPVTMIKKVAIAQGFRWAFPDELAGMPYTADEMDVKEFKDPITAGYAQDTSPKDLSKQAQIEPPSDIDEIMNYTPSPQENQEVMDSLSSPPDFHYGPSAAQLTRLHTISTKAGYKDTEMKEILRDVYKVDSSKKLNINQYNELCAWLEKNKKPQNPISEDLKEKREKGKEQIKKITEGL